MSAPDDCCRSQPTEDLQGRCLGKGAVLRVSFGNFLFFALHFVVLLGVTRRDNWRLFLHAGLWPLQLIGWAALLGMTFALPNHVFYIWGQVKLFLRLAVLIPHCRFLKVVPFVLSPRRAHTNDAA